VQPLSVEVSESQRRPNGDNVYPAKCLNLGVQLRPGIYVGGGEEERNPAHKVLLQSLLLDTSLAWSYSREVRQLNESQKRNKMRNDQQN